MSRPNNSAAAKPLISVVVPTKNSEDTLEACLGSVAAQGFGNLELIVVDAYSTDGTSAIAGKFASKFIRSSAGRAEARNSGSSSASGDIFVFIDSDMVLDKGVLADIADKMTRYDALVIPERGGGGGFMARCKALEKSCYVGDGDVECVRVVSRRVFTAVGGYDPGLLLAEDRDLHERIKERFSIGRTAAGLLHDASHMTFLSDMRKSYAYGKSLPRFVAKTGAGAGRWISTRPALLPRYLGKLAADPVHGAGLLAIRGLEYAAGAAGFIWAKLVQRPKAGGGDGK